MSNIFNSVLQPKVGKNAFNLSHDKKLSTKFGRLTPVLVQETLPGDIFRGNSQCLMRFAPMLAPIMHRVDVYIHFFYVPNRILWPDWEDWITGNNDEVEPPYFAIADGIKTYVSNGTTLDHLGMPSSDISGIVYKETNPILPHEKFNALPVAAFQRIWFEYYRDQNLEFPDKTAKDCMLVSGENTLAEVTIAPGTLNIGNKYRAWTKDYFTSALPWAQKGDAALIPVSGELGLKDPWTNPTGSRFIDPTTGDPYGSATNQNLQLTAGSPYATVRRNPFGEEDNGDITFIDSSHGYQINMSGNTIEDLRRAARMQEWLERNARGGTRYVESIYSHFNERVKDYRLDRPEYIGGSRNRVNISEVLQTSETTETGTPQGEMAGHGISAGYSGSYNYRCPEHGFIIGVMSVRPAPAYFQGVPRYFGARQDRLDYYWPTFAHLGEQAIENKELFLDMDNTELTPDGTFGYTPRYAEYRMNYSTVSGDFNTSLEFWHMARKFTGVPALNSQFVHVNDATAAGDLDRIFAVQDGTDYLWAHIYHDIKAIRPIPKFAIPSL